MSEEVVLEPPKQEKTEKNETPLKEIIKPKDELKSEDKKDIEDEEREKMLNEENKKEIGEVEKKKKALEEAAEREGGKKRIPIGGIKIPGFLRKSKDKGKDGDEKDEEADLLDFPSATLAAADDDKPSEPKRHTSFKLSSLKNHFKKKMPKETPAAAEGEMAEESTEGKRPGFMHGIKLPPLHLPKKFNLRKAKQEPDVEEGGGGWADSMSASKPAGLASMETLDESNGSAKHSEDKTGAVADDGLETVKLDSSTEEKAALDEEKPPPEKKLWDRRAVLARLATCYEYRCFIAGVVLFVVLLLFIIIAAITGPRNIPLTHAPVIDGRYIQAVTQCGYAQGVLVDGAYVFKGVPYSQPPVGTRRWRRPEPFLLETCWRVPLLAHNGTDPGCWQVYANGTVDGREDCLTLDIITPKVSYHNPLPVVVLFGADTMVGGSPGRLNLPSSRFCRFREVVFVRPNFRLGVLGFLASPSLSKADYPPTSGNYGLHDMVEALRWVKRNVEHFGGDPTAVTVLGHRAGATMLTAILASHKAHDLFARAWLSSGSAIFPGMPLTESEQINQDDYISKLNCNQRDAVKDVECLRSLDVEELIDNVPEWWSRVGQRGLPMEPEFNGTKHQWLVQDGLIIKEHPSAVWGAQRNLTVKLVIGTTAHADATKALYNERSEWTEKEVERKVASSLIGNNRAMVDQLFESHIHNRTFAGLAAILSEVRTVCPLLNLARQIPSTPFYIATEPRGDAPRLADINVDVDAILDRYTPRSPEQRRFGLALQQIFYRFVSLGKFDQHPADASSNRILLLGQDPFIVPDYPACNIWVSNDYVPRFARVD